MLPQLMRTLINRGSLQMRTEDREGWCHICVGREGQGTREQCAVVVIGVCDLATKTLPLCICMTICGALKDGAVRIGHECDPNDSGP